MFYLQKLNKTIVKTPLLHFETIKIKEKCDKRLYLA